MAKNAKIEKDARWADVKAKGEAIVAADGVYIVRNNPSEVEAYVMSGDVAGEYPVHDGGPYHVILSKKSWENSDNVGGWCQGYLCSCQWGRFNSGEPGPRQVGRFCSHAYAALLVSNMRARGEFMNDRHASMECRHDDITKHPMYQPVQPFPARLAVYLDYDIKNPFHWYVPYTLYRCDAEWSGMLYEDALDFGFDTSAYKQVYNGRVYMDMSKGLRNVPPDLYDADETVAYASAYGNISNGMEMDAPGIQVSDIVKIGDKLFYVEVGGFDDPIIENGVMMSSKNAVNTRFIPHWDMDYYAIDYEIYQTNGERGYDYRFESFDWAMEHGFSLKDYSLVYSGELRKPEGYYPDEEICEQLFTILNTNQPYDYRARSLSVSDIICLGGHYYYVDSIGFVEVDEETQGKFTCPPFSFFDYSEQEGFQDGEVIQSYNYIESPSGRYVMWCVQRSVNGPFDELWQWFVSVGSDMELGVNEFGTPEEAYEDMVAKHRVASTYQDEVQIAYQIVSLELGDRDYSDADDLMADVWEVLDAEYGDVDDEFAADVIDLVAADFGLFDYNDVYASNMIPSKSASNFDIFDWIYDAYDDPAWRRDTEVSDSKIRIWLDDISDFVEIDVKPGQRMNTKARAIYEKLLEYGIRPNNNWRRFEPYRSWKWASKDAMDSDRREYLEDLADEYGVDEDIVFMLADVLGPNEDYDGLITELEDLDFDMFASEKNAMLYGFLVSNDEWGGREESADMRLDSENWVVEVIVGSYVVGELPTRRINDVEDVVHFAFDVLLDAGFSPVDDESLRDACMSIMDEIDYYNGEVSIWAKKSSSSVDKILSLELMDFEYVEGPYDNLRAVIYADGWDYATIWLSANGAYGDWSFIVNCPQLIGRHSFDSGINGLGQFYYDSPQAALDGMKSYVRAVADGDLSKFGNSFKKAMKCYLVEFKYDYDTDDSYATYYDYMLVDADYEMEAVGEAQRYAERQENYNSAWLHRYNPREFKIVRGYESYDEFNSIFPNSNYEHIAASKKSALALGAGDLSRKVGGFDVVVTDADGMEIDRESGLDMLDSLKWKELFEEKYIDSCSVTIYKDGVPSTELVYEGAVSAAGLDEGVTLDDVVDEIADGLEQYGPFPTVEDARKKMDDELDMWFGITFMDREYDYVDMCIDLEDYVSGRGASKQSAYVELVSFDEGWNGEEYVCENEAGRFVIRQTQDEWGPEWGTYWTLHIDWALGGQWNEDYFVSPQEAYTSLVNNFVDYKDTSGRNMMQVISSRKIASSKQATRTFTYAEMQELEDEVIDKPWLNNADRLKSPDILASF